MKRVSNARSNFVGGAPSTSIAGVPSTIGAIPTSPSYISMAPSTDTMNTMNTSATQESVILELSRRLGEREAEVRSIRAQAARQQAQAARSPVGHAASPSHGAQEALLSHCRDQEEKLRVAAQLNKRLNTRLKEMERLHKDMEGRRAQLDRLAAIEAENKSTTAELADAQRVIEKKEELITQLTEEKEEAARKASEGEEAHTTFREESEEAQTKLQGEIARLEELTQQGKALAEDQGGALRENEATIEKIQDQCEGLRDAVEGLKGELEEKMHSIESKDALLDMQRQTMEKQLNQIQVFETQFQARDTDVPKLIARAEEGERLWSKIEEREKKFESKELTIASLRAENAALVAEKEELQAKLEEQKKCMGELNLKLSGTGDKIHVPWLLSQLRDTVQLKEKIFELEEIIEGQGYTVQAAAATADLQKREAELKETVQQLSETLKVLKTQTSDDVDYRVPTLVGKLEECLREYGYVIEHPPMDLTQILSAASSDLHPSMSLNTVETWEKSKCITLRDLQEFVAPEHYTVANNLANGVDSLSRDGLCSGPNVDEVDDDEEDEEEEAVVVEEEVNDVVEEDKENKAEDKENDEKVPEPDIHLQKVLDVLKTAGLVSPPTSPFSNCTSPPMSPFSCVSNAT